MRYIVAIGSGPARGFAAPLKTERFVHLSCAMDTYLHPSLAGERWSGVVLTYGSMSTALAHGQQIRMPNGFPEGKVTVYDAMIKVTYEGMMQLDLDESSRYVCIPADENMTMNAIKDLCAGLGCISMAAEFLGIRSLATMDYNEKVVEVMRMNGGTQALIGDITKSQDRFLLHTTPQPVRCILSSGFPCQPLSRQGDLLGEADARSQAFFATTRVAWEQQVAALLMECVPGAMSAPYVQEEIQKLASSMDQMIHQRIINLSKHWPSSRTRWWCLLVPRPIQIPHIPDLPYNEDMRKVESLFKVWPVWPESIEKELELREDELALYNDSAMGDDLRELCQNKPCPCILHSYGNLLEPCPCGCRSKAMSWTRLEQGGARGFYIRSQVTGKPRYLAAAEACALTTIPTSLKFPSQKMGLALVGQSAAPVQAVWMLSHLQQASCKPDQKPPAAVLSWTAERLRELWGTMQFPQEPDTTMLQVWNQMDLISTELKIEQGITAGQLRLAETKMQGHELKVRVLDGMGNLPDHHQLHHKPAAGHYVLWVQPKKQAQALLTEFVQLDVHVNCEIMQVQAQIGTFLFEALRPLGLFPESTELWQNGTKCHWDQRVFLPMQIHASQFLAMGTQKLFALGMNDLTLDKSARHVMGNSGKSGLFWIPAAESTKFFEGSDVTSSDGAWLTAALSGHLLTAICYENHWVLMHVFVQGSLLNVEVWDGMSHVDLDTVVKWTKHAKTKLALRTIHAKVDHRFEQTQLFTCGTIALKHLMHLLGLCTESMDDELETHLRLIAGAHLGGQIYGLGPDLSNEEREIVWKLREILAEKGVPQDHTEERAHHALAKIGLQKLQQALSTRNEWASLKALGSSPKINFLWVKPAELDAMIRKKAQEKFRVSSSAKKSGKNKKEQAPDLADPGDLQLIEGTFIDEEGNEVKQISLSEVGSNRAGVAFVHLADAIPYLQGTESLSLSGLALLTTSPIPTSTQGLLPVTAIRYLALYIPTGEAILIDGSLVQLGDTTVTRKMQSKCVQMSSLDTVPLKVLIYKDQWPLDWAEFAKAPVKTMLAHFPPFQLCKGNRCGEQCSKFHPPVDTELDSVIADVWGRLWITNRGKKVAAEQADAFQVMLRVPHICMKAIHWLSGMDGMYVEPRSRDGRSVEENLAVIWLNDATYQEAVHKQKTTDRALPITRFGNKYGIRVLKKDLEAIQTKLGVEDSLSHISVQKIYELRPLPFGTLKKTVQQMVTAWGWAARPIQPGKSDATGMSWKVGAETDPPGLIMQTNNGDVAISLQKQVMAERYVGNIHEFHQDSGASSKAIQGAKSGFAQQGECRTQACGFVWKCN